MDSKSKLISENNLWKVYLTKYTENQYVISVHEQFAHLAIKKWIAVKEQNKWYILNQQYKQGPIINMEYEWVTYPISFRSLKKLIITFTELTNNFTYYFPFPKE